MPDPYSYVDLDGERRTLPAEVLDELSSRHRGPCLVPGDPGFAEARQSWNAMIDIQPAVIAQASGVADVLVSVRFAREHGMLTSIRGGGHNVAGNALVEGGLVIDLSLMRNVQVDPARRRAWVTGGCVLGDVDHETQVHGLAAPLGAVSQTGVAGLTLGGGYGWLRSRYGLACDAVRTFEVVTADGRVVRATADQHADLYWALRGGGGNFGVVTGFEFELYPVGPEVVLVGIAYPLERIREILPAWRGFMEGAPPELVTNFFAWTLPDVEAFPPEARGKEVCLIGGCWTGPVDEGLRVLEPLRDLGPRVLDLTGPQTWCEVQSAFDAFFLAGERRNYWKSIYVDLDEAVTELFAERALQRPDPWVLVSAFSFNGRVKQVPAGGSAFGNRDARWLVSVDSGWVSESKDEECVAWTREFWSALREHSRSGGCYLNFPGLGEEGEALLRASYGGENYERLQRVKATWDPGNLFRMNQNIRPAPKV